MRDSLRTGRRIALSVFAVAISSMMGRNALAEDARTDIHRSTFNLSGVYELSAAPARSSRDLPDREIISTVRLFGRIRGEGFVDARFTTRRNKTWRSFTQSDNGLREDLIAPVLLQGRVAVGGGAVRAGRRSMPSSAAIIGKELRLSFPGRVRGTGQRRQRVYTIRMSLDGSLRVQAKISSVPIAAMRRAACGSSVDSASTESAPASVPVLPGAPIAAATESRVLTISTDADPEWYAKYGENSNAVIASIINTAEAIYDQQLGIRFRIVKQHVYAGSSPYVSTDAGYLLSEFVTNSENPINLAPVPETYHQDVDLKHMFTGKDMDGSVVGIAYIGVVCASPSLTYGITQSYIEAAIPGIFAHELGHNLGANHDVTDRTSLMYPSISVPPSDHFSAASLGEIQTHFSQFNACISSEALPPRDGSDWPTGIGPDPEPTPVDPGVEEPLDVMLRIGRRRVADSIGETVLVYGRMMNALGEPYAGRIVTLMADGTEVGSVDTDEDGKYKFFVRVAIPRGSTISIRTVAMDGQVRSNAMTLRRTVGKSLSTSRRR